MAEAEYSELFKIVKFNFRYHIFDDNGALNSPSFEFDTADDPDEFKYTWKVKYSLENNLNGNPSKKFKSNSAVQSENDPFEWNSSVDEDSMHEDENHGWGTPTRQNYDDSFTLNALEVGSQDKLISGDFAYVTIIVNGKNLLRVRFDSESTLLVRRIIPDFIIWGNEEKDAHVHVKVKVYHHYPKYSKKIIEDYSKFFENEKTCDVRFVIGAEEVRAHKQILSARNAVFSTMFESDMLEKENGRVEIVDIELNIFKDLLSFIYSGKISSDNLVDWLKLIVAADKYSMTHLVNICGNLIGVKLNSDNVIDIFVTADTTSAKGLKEKCKNFILENTNDVLKTEGYKNLVKSGRADLISEILCFIS